jgi:hypothetical protein
MNKKMSSLHLVFSPTMLYKISVWKNYACEKIKTCAWEWENKNKCAWEWEEKQKSIISPTIYTKKITNTNEPKNRKPI